MNDKNLDKLFSEKLAHHEVVPPAAAWETLAGALRQKRRKHRVGYRWSAAALLLVAATAGFILWLHQEKEAALPTARQPTVVSSPLAADEPRPVNEQANTLTETTPPPRSIPEQIASETWVSPVASPSPTKEPTRLEERPVTVPPALTERNVPATSAPVEEEKSTPPTLVVDASRYKKADSTTTQTTESVLPSEVTVIYQPNPSALARKKSLGQRIDKTLTFIQDHGIGFSELRSAKSHLVDKVFSKGEPEPDESGNRP